LQKKKLLSEDTLKLFVHQIANAMQAIHQLGIVHRDLKPANILLYHPGIVNPLPIQITFKLADFGLSRHLEESTMAITMCGSPLYMVWHVTVQH
jgi:serine/threonine-protein kinase ULK/ATG1